MGWHGWFISLTYTITSSPCEGEPAWIIRSGKRPKDREKGKKPRQTEKQMVRHCQGMDRHGVLQVSEGSGEQRKMQKTVRVVICGAQTTPTVTGLVKKVKRQPNYSGQEF